MKINISEDSRFDEKHIGTLGSEEEMLEFIGVSSMDELIKKTIPNHILSNTELDLPVALSEEKALEKIKGLASKNQVFKSYIGMGYHETVTPKVILRNILENPGWYTAYTPYQAEIAQGRLEMLLNFQTLIQDLTGMEISNASLLDEGTAAAEAMVMLFSHAKRKKKGANTFLVSETCHPQTIAILETRANPFGISLEVKDIAAEDVEDPSVFGVLLQYPDTEGKIEDYSAFIEAAHQHKVMVTMAADILSLVMLKSPGEMGADVVVGSSQRFGVPMGYGGPHAAFFATRNEFKRMIPGRIIGVSKTVDGKMGYRMALQTREQHIKRDKATSNICTAQVLLANIAAAYAIYHGKEGLEAISKKVHGLTVALSEILVKGGLSIKHESFFDTLYIPLETTQVESIKQKAITAGVNFRYFDSGIGISINETNDLSDIQEIATILLGEPGAVANSNEVTSPLPSSLLRANDILDYPVFKSYRREHDMLRYLKQLENKDLSLTHSMISLGSCTMKLNATTEMIPISWEGFANIHPFAPLDQAQGYQEMFKELEAWLAEITGFAAVSLQPNSGAQGEYAGLMAIKAYHEDNGGANRDIVLIPSSAHGTNPASAVMAGMKVVVVKCNEAGDIDIEDLKNKAELHKDKLSTLMITYPSTHGVFEAEIQEICELVHSLGGLVYMDGANMNAQVGLTSPGLIGADVCHLNLHKTFCIPHGGGGPGMGPIGVVNKLAPYLPNHPVVDLGMKSSYVISAAPWGSASILPISYAYIMLMGKKGLKKATEYAVLNANYLRCKLENHYGILYTGANGFCAHEMIVDFRDFKAFGIEVEDIAKRLMDYGFHAPTVSFPVAGTVMIEPTESESMEELDRFVEAMLSIREEIDEIAKGIYSQEDNVLKNAPHTADMIMADTWDKAYGREKAAYPLPYVRANKFWPTVRRVDGAYGDRNLVCSCTPIEEYV